MNKEIKITWIKNPDGSLRGVCGNYLITMEKGRDIELLDVFISEVKYEISYTPIASFFNTSEDEAMSKATDILKEMVK